jgi:hypothetical protein
LKLDGASAEEIQAAEDYLKDTRDHFDRLVKSSNRKPRNR